MRILSILASALFLTSCIADTIDFKVPEPQEGMADISFLAELPAPTVAATRSVGSIAENTVGDIYVLVFEKGGDQNLIYKGKGRNLAVAIGAGVTNNNKVTFKATLPVGTAYDFMVLANAEDALSGINVSDTDTKTKNDVVKLTQTLAAGTKWDSDTAIPMWGEVKDRKLAASDGITFKLTRMLARVNVEYKPTNISVNNFRLSSVRVYNYNTVGAIIPAAANWDSDDEIITAPTEPYGTGGYGKQTGEALVYSGSDITDNKKCQEVIYLFEAAHNGSTYKSSTNDDWIDNPCLVIGGKFSPDGTTWPANDTYYRVDFIKKTTSGETVTDEWLSILRNFSYNVTVTEVSGEGYADPDTALHSAPFGMEANVLDWNERNMEKVVFDGIFYLSVSRDEFVFQRHGQDSEMEDGANVVKIKTDYLVDNDRTNADSGWQVDKIEDLDGDPVTWLELVPDKRPNTWAPEQVNEAYFTFDENTGTANREAIVWIKAGRLRYPIHITQRILSLDILDADNNDAPVEELFFEIPRSGNRTHTPRNFKVKWTPTARPVSITGVSPKVYNPFAPGWVTGNYSMPEPDQTTSPGVIPASSGTQTFTVQPPTVTNDDLDTDPFYEKETTYWFEVVNDGDREKKGIKLHQIYYNILVDTYAYRLDGKTYSLNVRSNTPWKIKKIEELLYNEDPATLGTPYPDPVLLELRPYDNLREGSTGKGDVNGETLAFTVVDRDNVTNGPIHKEKWGSVRVTFESPNDKFDDFTVDLVFPPDAIPILGMGDAVVDRAYNVCKPSSYHLTSAHTMLSSYLNFGVAKESTVKSAPLVLYGHNVNAANSTPLNNTSADEWYWRKGHLKKWINQYKPALIVIAYPTVLSANESRLLIEYLKNGGAAIMYYGGGGSTNTEVVPFFTELFGRSISSTNDMLWKTADTENVLQLRSDLDHPILNGPFGDMRGHNFGTHIQKLALSRAFMGDDVTNLIMSESVQNYSSANPSQTVINNNAGYSYAFVHNEYNLFWIGNSMGTATYYHFYQNTVPNYDPMYVNEDGTPGERSGFSNYGVNSPYTVYNSYVLANAVAWALSVTNYRHPSHNYANGNFPD